MARSYRSPHTPRRPFIDSITNVVALAMVVIVGWLAWPMLVSEFQSRVGLSVPTISPPPTAQPVRPQLAPVQPQLAAPAIPGIAQNAATAQAAYDAAVRAAETQPNVNTTNDSAPVVVESKPAERMPAGANAPTAEPIAPAESGGIFGSKPVVTDPQATHECRHGQVWTDAGCKNPTPVGGG